MKTDAWLLRRAVLWLALLSTLGLAGVALAQSDGELTIDLVDSRIQQLNDDGVQGDVLAAYEEVRRILGDANAFNRETEEYDAALESAPRTEEAIQQRLDDMADDYDAAAEIEGLVPEELNQRLSQARLRQDELTQQLTGLDRTLAGRESNAERLRLRLAEIDDLLAGAQAQAGVDTSGQASLAEASAWRSLAQVIALEAEGRVRRAELNSQPARFSAMVAQREELRFEADRLSALISTLGERLAGAVPDTAAADPVDLAESDPARPVAESILALDREVVQRREDLSARLVELQLVQDQVSRNARVLEDRAATARRLVDYAGDSKALGAALFSYWREIDGLDEDIRARSFSDAGTIVIQRVQHEELLAQLSSASNYVNEKLTAAGVSAETVAGTSRATLVALTREFRQNLRDTIGLESDYLSVLGDLQTSISTFETQIEHYRDFLQRLVLWFPNHPPLWVTAWDAVALELQTIIAATGNLRLVASPTAGMLIILALLLWRARPGLRALQARMDSLVARPRSDGIQFTLAALAAATARALPLPLILLAWSRTVVAPPDRPGISLGIASLWLVPAGLLFVFDLLRTICEPEGLGSKHFGWHGATVNRDHQRLTLLIRWWLPLAILAGFANVMTADSGDAVLGRWVTLVGLLIVAGYFGWFAVREIREMGAEWFRPFSSKLRLLLMITLAALVFAVISGRMFTVVVLFECLIATILTGGGLLLTHAVLIRWLFVTRRKLRLNELLAQRSSQGPAEPMTTEEGAAVEEPVPDLGDLSNDSQQLVNLLTAVVAAVAAFYIWEPLLPALGSLGEVQLWTSITEVDGESVTSQITLATVLIVLILGIATLYAARRLPALVEMVLRSRTGVSPGARYTVSTLLNYIIVGAGVLFALSALGLQWSQLQWLVAALGVGIGFGLQEIVANFISGLIILFERPIRVGDIVTVGDKDGTVTRIRIRATTIRDWDGKELLVPNKEFITGHLLNWSLSDSQTRVVIPVGVAYGSNVEKALGLLREIVAAHPNTLDEPEPLIVFEHFGDNALELSARCFLGSLDGRLKTMTELRTAINNAFEDAGIVIAFPQRDVHIDTPLTVRLEPNG